MEGIFATLAFITRCYLFHSVSGMTVLELHVFSDASEKAITGVAYIVGVVANGERHVVFFIGKSNIAPSKGHTIPRLELCVAVLAVELKQLATD